MTVPSRCETAGDFLIKPLFMKRIIRLGLMALLCFGGIWVKAEEPVIAVPTVKIGQGTLKISGFGQATYTAQEAGDAKSNAIDVQRFFAIANAQMAEKLSFLLMYDFAGSKMHEYYVQYAFSPALKLRVGQYKLPFTIENLLPPTLISNVGFDESAGFMAGFSSDPCYGMGRVGRDVGVMITGDLWQKNGHTLVNYYLGVFNGTGMNQKENNNQKDVVGQLNVSPWKGTTLSGSFMLGTGHAQTDSPFGCFVAGENYRRNRFSVGLSHKDRWADLRTEAMWGNDGGAKSMGWYANAEIHLMKRLDLVANYDYLKRNLDLDGTATHNWLGGLQYWIHKQCCLRSQYVYKNRQTGDDTKAWITQLQIAF